jgi:hypothetical protein
MDVYGLATPLFCLYLLVFCNFTPEVLGCRLQSLLRNNMLLKHFMTMFLLFALIVLVNPENADLNFTKNVLLAIFVYIWYIMTIRTPLPVTAVVLMILTAVYILNSTKHRAQKEDSPKEVERIRRIQNILTYIAFAISVIGFVMYFIEKKREYKTKFNYSTFMFGTKQCRGYTPTHAYIVKSATSNRWFP